MDLVRCGVCSHAERKAIEAALASGASARDVAATFGVAERALAKHVEGGHASRTRAEASPATCPPGRRGARRAAPGKAKASTKTGGSPAKASAPPAAPARRPRLAAVPPPPPVPEEEPSGVELVDLDEDDDDDGPATSQSHEIVARRPTTRAPGSSTARAQLDEMVAEIRSLLEAVRRSDASYRDTASIIRTGLSAIRLYGQLTGELGANETTVATSPHYRRIRTAIVEALRPFPEAMRAVLDALERAEGGGNGEAAA